MFVVNFAHLRNDPINQKQSKYKIRLELYIISVTLGSADSEILLFRVQRHQNGYGKKKIIILAFYRFQRAWEEKSYDFCTADRFPYRFRSSLARVIFDKTGSRE